MAKAKITIIVDNTVAKEPLLAEWGLAYWIEMPKGNVIFDTGKTSEVFFANCSSLGIDSTKAQACVISHGHYDHNGALEAIVAQNNELPVFAHSKAFQPRFCNDEEYGVEYLGAPFVSETIDSTGGDNNRLHNQAKFVVADKPTEIIPNLWCCGEVPRTNSVEDTGGQFYLDREKTLIDPIVDDLSLFIKTSRGLVAILGCAHAGVVNILDYMVSLAQQPIYAVIGGMHLFSASKSRLEFCVAEFTRHSPSLIVPCHCTGANVAELLRQRFGNVVRHGGSGASFEFEL